MYKPIPTTKRGFIWRTVGLFFPAVVMFVIVELRKLLFRRGGVR